MLFSAVSCVLFYFSTETKDIEEQERVSELIAEEYLVQMSQHYNDENDIVQDEIISGGEYASDLEYNDNEIYSYFDESYACGYVDCVLEIPAIDLRQSIFTGTPDQIQHDLGRWLSVTARSDYILGDTHYCIYMHNPRNKSIRISYAQENLHEKDYMIITKKGTVYLYKVTGVFPEWRNKCTDNYVNNMAVSNDKLYIFTCGRDEWQGRNVVIEGTVHAVYNTQDWLVNKDAYIEEYKKCVGTIVEPEIVEKQELILMIESKDDDLLVSLCGPNYTNVSNCFIGICNADGYLVEGVKNLIEYNGSSVIIERLPEGEYYIGVYENNTEYNDPIPYKITIDKKTYTQSIVTMVEDANRSNEQTSLIKSIAIIMFIMAVLLGLTTVFKIAHKSKVVS
jgi:sortase (surface protein transpeptidase)